MVQTNFVQRRARFPNVAVPQTRTTQTLQQKTYQRTGYTKGIKNFSSRIFQQRQKVNVIFQKDHLDTMSKPPNKIRWGNQEPLWKVKISSNDPNERISNLAQPKKNFKKLQPLPQFEFSCGRSSPIRATKKLKPATDRLIELARSKNNNLKIGVMDKYQFSCGRSSPIWKVSSVSVKKPCILKSNVILGCPICSIF